MPEIFFGAIARARPVSATSAAFAERTFVGRIATIDSRIGEVGRAVLGARRDAQSRPDPAGRHVHARRGGPRRAAGGADPGGGGGRRGRLDLRVHHAGRAGAAPRRAPGPARAGTVEVLDGIAAGEAVVRAGCSACATASPCAPGCPADERRRGSGNPGHMISDFCIKRPVFASGAQPADRRARGGLLLRLPVRELPDVDSAGHRRDHDLYRRGARDRRHRHHRGDRGRGRRDRRGQDDRVHERARPRPHRDRVRDRRDIDEAANDVRDAVARVRDDLPDEVDQPQITKVDSDSDPILRIAITSDRLTRPRSPTMPSATSSTGCRPSRAWRRSRSAASSATRCASGSTARRWRRAISRSTTSKPRCARNNVELPAGRLRIDHARVHPARPEPASERRAVRADHRGQADRRLPRPPGRRRPGRARLEDDQTIVRSNGERVGRARRDPPARRPTRSTSRSRVREDRSSASSPTCRRAWRSTSAPTTTVFIKRRSEGGTPLAEAIALVLLVICLFLGSGRAALIPAVTVPVCLIGAFIALYAFGFSINLLTLLALVLHRPGGRRRHRGAGEHPAPRRPGRAALVAARAAPARSPSR